MATNHRVSEYADPVGLQEIVERLGISRGTVDQWGYRGLLPEGDYTIGGRDAWEWATIVDWCKETGREHMLKNHTKKK